MNMKFLTTCIVLILIAVVAVAYINGNEVTETPNNQTVVNITTIITLERTPCFGFCPIYKLTIYDDGKVLYEGDRFVNVTGNHTSQISLEKVAEIRADFERINYFSLSNTSEGDLNCATDNPSVITSLTVGNQSKMIHNYHGCPGREDLRALEDKIDALTESSKWVEGN